MSDLSPKARRLVDAARAAGGSTPADRTRVRVGMAAKIGASIATGAAIGAVSTKAGASTVGAALTAPTGTLAKLGAIAWISKTLIVVAVVGSSAASVVWIRARSTTPSRAVAARGIVRTQVLRAVRVTPRTEPSSRAIAPVVELPPIAIVPEATVLENHAPIHVRSVPRGSSARIDPPMQHDTTAAVEIEPQSSLADEMALVHAARVAVRAHDGATALSLLDQHQRQFPSGMLSEERAATRVLALCQLDRLDDARQAARAFFQSYPHSPHAGRVRTSCAGESP